MALPVSICIDGFLDGFTGSGLFGRLRRPGAPTEFVDSRSVEEFLESGEFDSAVNRFHAAAVENDGMQESAAPSAIGGINSGDRQHVAKHLSGHR